MSFKMKCLNIEVFDIILILNSVEINTIFCLIRFCYICRGIYKVDGQQNTIELF